MKKITINENVMWGQRVFEGTRVLVSVIEQHIDEGRTTEWILKNFPSLNTEDLKQLEDK